MPRPMTCTNSNIESFLYNCAMPCSEKEQKPAVRRFWFPEVWRGCSMHCKTLTGRFY